MNTISKNWRILYVRIGVCYRSELVKPKKSLTNTDSFPCLCVFDTSVDYGCGTLEIRSDVPIRLTAVLHLRHFNFLTVTESRGSASAEGIMIRCFIRKPEQSFFENEIVRVVRVTDEEIKLVNQTLRSHITPSFLIIPLVMISHGALSRMSAFSEEFFVLPCETSSLILSYAPSPAKRSPVYPD